MCRGPGGPAVNRGFTSSVPEKSDEIAARGRRGSRGGRPRGLDTTAYRGLATRYDKLAITYRAAVILAVCLTWTRLWET